MESLGPYRILRSIAMGGMGEVHLAALERTGGFEKQVALKSILPRLMKDEKFIDLFEREARLAALLSHRNIVQIFDFGRSDENAWLAMEYVHGVDLRVVMVSGITLPVELVVDIGMNCARALDYAHRAKDPRGHPLHIIHRDVSPQNILVSYEGDIKLADFGLALASAHGRDEDDSLKGKFAYMSPEQAMGQDLDERTDQFSLAVVLYELFSGVRAFHTADGPATVLRRVTQGTPERALKDVAPHLPDSIVQVIERAMSPNRRDRFVDSGTFGEALKSAAIQGEIELGQSRIGAWLRTHFPDAAQSHTTGPLNEATEVAAEPINLGPLSIKTLALADTEVGLDESLDVTDERDEERSVLTPGHIDTPTVEPTESVDRRSAVWWFVALSAVAAIVLFFSDWPDDFQEVGQNGSSASSTPSVQSTSQTNEKSPSSLLPVLDASGFVPEQSSLPDVGLLTSDGGLDLGPSESDPSHPVEGKSSVNDANPPAKVGKANDGITVPPVKTKRVRARNRRRSRRAPLRPTPQISSRKRTPKVDVKMTESVRSKVPNQSPTDTSVSLKKKPSEKRDVKMTESVRSKVPVQSPTDTSVSLKKKPSEKKEDGPENQGEVRTNQFPSGPRILLLSTGDPFSVAGPRLVEGWKPVSARGTLLESLGSGPPKVKLKLRAKGGRISVAVQTSPHVSILKNGASQGFSPRAGIPLVGGTHTFVFGDQKTGVKTLKFRLVE